MQRTARAGRRPPMRLGLLGVAALSAAAALQAALQSGCHFLPRQPRHFTLPAPVSSNPFLVVGFLGGQDAWNDATKGIRKLALKLRAQNLPAVSVETAENRNWQMAVRLIRSFLDRNRDGLLSEPERSAARILLYGQSFGGAAVVKTARELDELGVPVLLTVQIDSVGLSDGLIPPNVQCAANLFQHDGWLIRGERPIRAANPERTRILGNFQYHYPGDRIDLSRVPWWKKIFREAHTKMEHDPEVWSRVESLIVDAVKSGCPG